MKYLVLFFLKHCYCCRSGFEHYFLPPFFNLVVWNLDWLKVSQLRCLVQCSKCETKTKNSTFAKYNILKQNAKLFLKVAKICYVFVCCNWVYDDSHVWERTILHFCYFFYLLFFTVRNHGIASDKPAHVPIAPTSSSISTSDNSLDAQT